MNIYRARGHQCSCIVHWHGAMYRCKTVLHLDIPDIHMQMGTDDNEMYRYDTHQQLPHLCVLQSR